MVLAKISACIPKPQVQSSTVLEKYGPMTFDYFGRFLNFEWNYTQLEFKPGAVEINKSTIGPPAGIEHTLLRCRCNVLATELQR